MRASKYLIPTLREAPQDAVAESHKLMLRAGLARKQGSGLYHLLPLGLRIFHKIEAIIREEMNRAGALEFQAPILTPCELWQTSGRWESMGREMFRVKDRHGVWNAMGPTHEESFTELLQSIIHSYRDLPINVYQIHTKFRDEIRPRFGVIRSREFCMKDAYSFHRDYEDLDKTYQLMRSTYRRIFARMGLETIAVEADSGNMGGSGSEEFMVAAAIGEETLLLSEGGKYRGNQEKTPVIYADSAHEDSTPHKITAHQSISHKGPTTLERIETPGCDTIEKLIKFLEIDASKVLKTLMFMADGVPLAACIRGDREINELKLKNALKASHLETASHEDLTKAGLKGGYIGPPDINGSIPIYFDDSLNFGGGNTVGENSDAGTFLIGGGQQDLHLSGYAIPENISFIDIALARAGDPSPEGDGLLRETRGIEVGHIFKLGDKYARTFGLKYLDENGRADIPVMGCYGIGVHRSLAVIIEQHHDEKGICWPMAVAPYEVCLIGITKTDEEILAVQNLYEMLLDLHIEVLWDDRKLRPGVKFADAELIGYPIRIVMGKTFFAEEKIEIMIRQDNEKYEHKFELKGNVQEICREILQIRNDLLVLNPDET